MTFSSIIDSPSREKSLFDIISTSRYGETNDTLKKVICALGEATAHCSTLLANNVDQSYAGSQNASGDNQLRLDIECDRAVFGALRRCGKVATAASEETPVETQLMDTGDEDECYAVGFDPLDGSSIIQSNFSVGSIFGVWPGKTIIGRHGREQVASAIAVYGPRTTLCIALPDDSKSVLEVTLLDNNTRWVMSNRLSVPDDGRVFAPGNLRASNDNDRYMELITHWITRRYTLRYTGGMVPDVYHILSSGKGGVFSNVSSEKARAKLRLLYEVAPIGFLMECAGGHTTHESKDISVLDIPIEDLDQRLGCCFGSKKEVQIYRDFMFKNP